MKVDIQKIRNRLAHIMAESTYYLNIIFLPRPNYILFTLSKKQNYRPMKQRVVRKPSQKRNGKKRNLRLRC